METMIGVGVLVALVLVIIAKTATVVPQQNAYVIEKLGKFGGYSQMAQMHWVKGATKQCYSHTG